MHPTIKKSVRILKYVFLSVILLALLFVVIVHLPFTQRFITNKVNEAFRENGIPVRVGELRFSLNGKIGISQLEINSKSGDTIAYAESIHASVSIATLFSRKIWAGNVELNNVVFNLQTEKNTGELVLLSLFSASPSPDTIVARESSWDVEIRDAHMENIRFMYGDSSGGVLVSQSIQKAEVTFNEFSILKKKIRVNSFGIEKGAGQLVLWKSIPEKIQPVSSSADTQDGWKFSCRDLELNEFTYEFIQPDEKQRTSCSLTHAEIILQELDLGKSRLAISSLKLINPDVKSESSHNPSSENRYAEVSETKDSSAKNWDLKCESLKIENGRFLLESDDTIQGFDYADWLPVEKINTEIADLKFGDEGAGFNMSQLSMEFNKQIILTSGEILFTSDTSMNGSLKAELKAAMNLENQKLFKENDIIKISTDCSGSLDSLVIAKCNVNCSNGIDLSVSGYLSKLLKMPDSECKLNFRTSKITREQTSEIIALAGRPVNLPSFDPVDYSGTIEGSFLKPEFKLMLNSSSGVAALQGKYDSGNNAGRLDATFTQIRLKKIVGDAYPESLSCDIALNGRVNKNKQLSGDGVFKINALTYKDENYQDINLKFSVVNNQSTFTLVSGDSSLRCNLDGIFNWNDNVYEGKLSGNFDVNKGNGTMLPGHLSLQGEIEGAFKSSAEDLQSSLNLKKLIIGDEHGKSNIDTFSCGLKMSNDLVTSQIKTDFLSADFQSESSFDELKNAIAAIRFENLFSLDSTEFLKLNSVSAIPSLKLTAAISYHSIFQLLYPDSVLNFDTLYFSVYKNPEEKSVQGEFSGKNLRISDYTLHGVRMTSKLDENNLNCILNMDSAAAPRALIGTSAINISIQPLSMVGSLSISDREGTPLFKLGTEVKKEKDRLVMNSTEGSWIINSYSWELSPTQFLTRDNRTGNITSDLHMQSGNMKIEFVSNGSDSLGLILKDVSLNALVSPGLIKNMPEGLVNANVTYTGIDQKDLNFKFDVHQFKWQDLQLEKMAAAGNLVIDTSGVVGSDIQATLNDSSSITITSENDNTTANRSFHSTFTRIPVRLLQPVIKEYIDNLKGTASGDIALNIKGDKPTINGEIGLQQVSLKVISLESPFSIPDNKLVIEKSHLNFEDFTILDSLQKPLHLNGTINLENLDSIIADLKVKTNNLQVMNTTVADDPGFYGTMVVSSGLEISGPIQNPAMKGTVALVKGTNITYRQIEDLSVKETEKTVTFAKFNVDSLVKRNTLRRQELSGMPLLQTEIVIDPATIFNIEFSSGFDINVKVLGKGLLNYAMLPNNTISLSGSYEVLNGTSDLKFTGWPMKKFSITPGSSIQWDGKYDDPQLNIEATSKVKGSYLNPIDNKDRTVDFIVSMKMLEHLTELRIIFDVKSNDQYITNVFSTLSSDEVMRQAINLLIFESVDLPGMESSTSYMSAQMNSFWESQLNNLTKTTVKNVDISFGIDTYKQTSSSGAEEEKTSLSYEMERKFFKDRASVKISGRFNDETTVEGKQSNNVIENFSFEYALDTLDKKHIKIFRNQDYEDVLEGEVIKSGVGFIYRRSYPSLRDIWKRKAKKKTETVQPQDKKN